MECPPMSLPLMLTQTKLTIQSSSPAGDILCCIIGSTFLTSCTTEITLIAGLLTSTAHLLISVLAPTRFIRQYTHLHIHVSQSMPMTPSGLKAERPFM